MQFACTKLRHACRNGLLFNTPAAAYFSAAHCLRFASPAEALSPKGLEAQRLRDQEVKNVTYDRRLADQQFKSSIARKCMKAEAHAKAKPTQERMVEIKSMIDKS